MIHGAIKKCKQSNMKKVVKITENQLNEIIRKVIKEQEGQVMNTGPSPEQMTGTPEGDSEPMADSGPNFGEFINCAKELLDQGVTVGNLVDQILEAQEAPEEDESTTTMPGDGVEGGTEPEMPVA